MSDTKVTAEVKETFLELLLEIPNITEVSKLLGISPSTIRKHRDRDKKWDEAICQAKEDGYDGLEAEAIRRAKQGVVEPVFYRGEQVVDANGKPTGIRRYSDSLLTVLLKAYRPAKFNPGAKVELGAGDDKVTMTFNIQKGED